MYFTWVLFALLLRADFQSVVGGVLGDFRGVVGGLHCRVSDFIYRVVVHRRDEAVRGWRSWIREDGSSIQVVKGLIWCLLPPSFSVRLTFLLGVLGVVPDPGQDL